MRFMLRTIWAGACLTALNLWLTEGMHPVSRVVLIGGALVLIVAQCRADFREGG